MGDAIHFLLQVPTDNELLKQWVYDRYIEKESMLATYYATGKFPDHRRPDEFCLPRQVLHDGFRTVILHVLYITSTLFHWNLLTLLFSSIFWDMKKRGSSSSQVLTNVFESHSFSFFFRLILFFVRVVSCCTFVLVVMKFPSARSRSLPYFDFWLFPQIPARLVL